MKEDIIRMVREAGFFLHWNWDRTNWHTAGFSGAFEHFADLVAAAERKRFYGQDKPAECADGCPPNQICDYCQVVAPAKASMNREDIIAMAREAGLQVLASDAVAMAENAYKKGQADEREACAALLEDNAMGCDNPLFRSLLQANAAAIRAMGKT